MRIVVDADVLIGALDSHDAHHKAARALFTGWHERGDAVSVSAINLSEALVAPAADGRRVRLARTAIAALGVSVHRPGEAVAADAARLRRTHPISLADAYCLATARHSHASLASFDEKVRRAAWEERLQLVS